RAFGFQRGMANVGAAFGPLLAAGFLWLWPEHLRALFLVALLPGLLVVVLLLFGLRETPAAEPPRERLRLTLKPFDRNFRLYLVALVVITLGSASDAFLLVWAGELGVPTALLPLLWCACHVGKSTSNLVLGRAVDQFGPRPFVCLDWFVHAGGLPGLCPGDDGLASMGLLPGLRPGHRPDRASGEDAGGQPRGRRAQGPGLRLVQWRRRGRHPAGEPALRGALSGLRGAGGVRLGGGPGPARRGPAHG